MLSNTDTSMALTLILITAVLSKSTYLVTQGCAPVHRTVTDTTVSHTKNVAHGPYHHPYYIDVTIYPPTTPSMAVLKPYQVTDLLTDDDCEMKSKAWDSEGACHYLAIVMTL
ncbi:hypothetical protein F5146DRAFT_577646 [Armillaria mellea]|nr:hypothetical protein F5146DRAFT_577646 [Armillaria mellea]